MPYLFLYLLIIFLSLLELGLCLAVVLAALSIASALSDKLAFYKLKAALRKNPRLGLKDEQGYLVFKQARFTLKYKLLDTGAPFGREQVEFISLKRKRRRIEEKIDNIKTAFRDFWVYSEWIYFFRPRVLFSLLSCLLLFYFIFFEPGSLKAKRVRSVISHLLRVPAESVEVAGGWIKVSGQRATAVDKKTEPTSYNLQPFQWLTFADDGYILRNRGEGYGSVRYPVSYNETGEFQLKKEGRWISGQAEAGSIKWENPQGSGIREGHVLGHKEASSEDGVLIKDIEN